MLPEVRHPYTRLRNMEPYQSKLFNVARKPVVYLSDEVLFLLGKIEELLNLLERQRQYWITTSSTVTLNAIALVQSTLLAITQALKSEDYILERCIAALVGKQMCVFVKAVRCPVTNDQTVINQAKLDRQILKNGSLFYLGRSQ
jgi:hypothetical protein